MTVWTIYMITGPSGKRYVGLTKTSARKRLNQHHLYARNGLKSALYNAMRAHGTVAFSISVLTECVDAREAIACERGLIAQYGTMAPRGYNLTIGGERGAGYKLSPEHRAKIAKTWPGRRHTDESRAKMSVSAKGRKRSPEALTAARKAWAENHDKWSAERRARWADPAYRKKQIALLNSPKAMEKKKKSQSRVRRERFERDPQYRAEMILKAEIMRAAMKRKREGVLPQ